MGAREWDWVEREWDLVGRRGEMGEPGKVGGGCWCSGWCLVKLWVKVGCLVEGW